MSRGSTGDVRAEFSPAPAEAVTVSFPSPAQNVLRKVQHQDALQISDVVMASLLRMFQSTAGSGGVQEDALMAVSTLVEGRCCTGGAGGSGAGQSPCASFSF